MAEQKTAPKQERAYLMETKDGELVRVPESRLSDWTTARRGGDSAASSRLRRRVEERLLHTILNGSDKPRK